MPTYEYRCKACDQHLEVVQSFTDEPLAECPACGGTLRKVFGSIGITFKGSGFYKTDSRAATSSGSSKSSASESGSASSGSGGTAGSSKDATASGSASPSSTSSTSSTNDAAKSA